MSTVPRFAFWIVILMLAACAAPVDETSIPTAIPTAQPTSTPHPAELCGRFIDRYDPLIDRFYDAGAVADNTARVALSGPVADLQAVRREMEALGEDLPPCAENLHAFTLEYMNALIESLLMFMRDEPESAVTAVIRRAVESRQKFIGARNLIGQELLLATRQAED